ncbi:hypothetical protein AURDEDRAFT_115320 [Auricularia subglabra TFB-10046 SS5]|nr:hypothetical protein AURDEDRAFT_115320 [Auricularia subglabra TFB-10046 SS5]
MLPTFLHGFFQDLFAAICVAFWPTLHAISSSPSTLLRPFALRRIFFAHVWTSFSAQVDEGGRAVKQGLVTPHAAGVVLDIGAGHGHTMHYLDRTRVTKYIALEPNKLMHTPIRRTAAECGYSEYDGNLVIVPLTASELVASRSLEPGSVDTITCILTLCSIPDAQRTIHDIIRTLLRPGGQFLLYEHVDSPVARVRWWQQFLAPVWAACFDGCTIGLPSHRWVRDADDWATVELWGKDGEMPDNMFYHQVGRFVRAS